MDGYARSDVLATQFNYDNSDFIDGLKKLGFFIPDCAFSNYITTTPSLSSSLNMDYLSNMGISEVAATDSYDPSLSNLVIQSKVRRIFESMGYKIAAFRGFVPAIDLHDADYYYNLEEKEKKVNLIAMHSFERLYLRTTILRPLVEAYENDAKSLENFPDWFLNAVDMHSAYSATDSERRLEILYTYQVLPTLPELPGIKFVYAHIYSSHFPYLFDPDGGLTPQSMRYSAEGYTSAVKFTSKEMLGILQTVLEKSKTRPIIIVQGDHGMPHDFGLPRNKILNAYYFPDGDYSRLYSTITPVNTFRVVLSQFFGQDFPLLPDTVMIEDPVQYGRGAIHYLPASCSDP